MGHAVHRVHKSAGHPEPSLELRLGLLVQILADRLDVVDQPVRVFAVGPELFFEAFHGVGMLSWVSPDIIFQFVKDSSLVPSIQHKAVTEKE